MAEKTPGFDLVLTELKGIVEKLETGNLSLEQSLHAFEEGVRLSRTGAQILDAAEKRVEILMKQEGSDMNAAGAGASDRAVPFSDPSNE